MPKNTDPKKTPALPVEPDESENVSEEMPRRRVRPGLVIVVVVLLIVGGIGLAAALDARTQPGALFSTEDAVGMVLGTAEPKATLTQPIVLQEGSDAEHEMSHIFEPLKGGAGLARGQVKRDGTAVVITYDPELVTEALIVEALRGTGYVQ